MNKKINTLIVPLFVLVFFTACQSDNESSDNNKLPNDTLPTLADSIVKSDKEKSDSILKYYQDKANEAEETPVE